MQQANRTRHLVEWVLGIGIVAGMLAYSIVPNIPAEQKRGKVPTEGDYWAVRLTYPTFQYDARWQTRAYEDHKRMQEKAPAGLRRSLRGGSSPLDLDANAFTFLGPLPEINGGYGEVAGRMNWIVVDPVDTSIAYAGSDGGGVWKSSNCCSANMTWEPKTDDPLLNSIAIGHIVIDPNDHEVVYAGTGDLRYGSFSFGSAGLLRSQDQGETWETLGADVFNAIYDQPAGEYPQYQAIGKVQVDPRNSNNIVVGTKQGIFFSYDFGANWAGPCYTNGFSSQRQDTTGLELIDRGSSTQVIAAIGTRGFNTPVQPDLDQNGANGLYDATLPASGCPTDWALISRSDNGWPAGTGGGTPYPSNTMGRIDIAVAPSDPDVIYAQVAAIPSRGQLGVWRSIDGGVSWQQRSDVNGLTGCFGDWQQNWYDAGIIVDPNDIDTVFMSTVDLFRSTNGGSSFTNVTCGYMGGSTHVDHHARAYVGTNSDQMLIGSDGGVYYVPNATEVSVSNIDLFPVNDTLGTIEFYSGDITANFATAPNPGINAGAQDNGSSVKIWSAGDPTAAEWVRRTPADGMYARIEPIQEQRWYQEKQNGDIQVFPNGPFGGSQVAHTGFGGDTLSFVFPYELNKFDCGAICEQMIAGTTRVWETIDGAIPASSWYPNSPDLTKGTLGGRSFINQLAFAVDDGNPDGHIDVGIAGTNDGNVWMGFGLGQGTSNSASWVNLTDGNTLLPNRPILDVATDPVIPTIGYAAVGGFDENTPLTPGHVFQVTCNADCSSFTWANKSGNLPNVPTNSIIANPNFPQQVFAGTDWGLYYTDNINVADPTWFKFSDGLPSVMIWDMSIDRGFTTLVLWTRSRGAYAWPLPFDAVGDVIFRDSLEDQP